MQGFSTPSNHRLNAFPLYLFAAALAIHLKAKVVTGDPEFKKLENEVGVEWLT